MKFTNNEKYFLMTIFCKSKNSNILNTKIPKRKRLIKKRCKQFQKCYDKNVSGYYFAQTIIDKLYN